MMNFTEDEMTSPIYFNKYDNGTFELNIGSYSNSIAISREDFLDELSDIVATSDITNQHIDILLKSNPEIILIGTGLTQQIPPIEIIAYLASKGRSVDFMNSNSACKTFNLLANENRKVCAIIIP